MRSSIIPIATSTLALALGGCIVQLPGNLDAGEDETTTAESGSGESSSSGESDTTTTSGTDTDTDTETDSDTDTDTDSETGEPPSPDGDGCQEQLDIVVIVDNSGSTGLMQRRLAESVEALLTPLDEAGVDWRLGITTTDVSNPWCPPGATTPEAGNLQMRACNDHLEDFIFNNGGIDVSADACTDICPYAPGKLNTLPTTTASDPDPSPRPWIERIDGESNLPGDVDPAVAALCLVPQGINGCGFEQPLQAMALALDRATTPEEDEFGFLRAEASLLVIIVSDEVDCSHTPVGEEIFDANGNRVFWSDPNSAFPSSAVCWNAGVRCVGDPSGYDDCVAQDYDLDGMPSTEGEAVLQPISNYIGQLQAIEDSKRALDPGADVAMVVIGGVGLDGELVYADVGDVDPAHQQSFGIGPGCAVPDPFAPDEQITGLPPVRMREVALAMSSDPLGSVCAADFSQPFGVALEQLVGACES